MEHGENSSLIENRPAMSRLEPTSGFGAGPDQSNGVVIDDGPYVQDEEVSLAGGTQSPELKEEVNVAIIGESGVGKSTLINTLRGIKPGEKGAAPVSAGIERTCEPTPYIFPDNKYVKLNLFDLPGAGTNQFPIHTYMANTFDPKYHFYILIICRRFSENSIRIAKDLERRGKKILVVRSMVDMDIVSQMDCSGGSTEDAYTNILKDVTKIVGVAGVMAEEYFLLNCRDREQKERDTRDLATYLSALTMNSEVLKPLEPLKKPTMKERCFVQ